MKISEIADEVKKSSNIAIVFHVSPDGDSIGSSLALLLGLRKLNKNVYIVSKEAAPETFKFLPGIDEISSELNEVKVDTDCLIAVDTSDTDRLNANLNLDTRRYKLINLDHHISNDLYADFNYVDAKAAAASEVIYELLTELNIEIDKNIAACLYTAIMTDTGSFRFSNTTNRTHTIAGKLIDTGIDFSSIHRAVFDNKSVQRIRLYGLAIEKMKIYNDICMMFVTRDMLKKVGIDSATDTSDIISFGMSIGSIEAGALIKETDDGLKVSFRSKSKIDVRKVAEKFGGGGHIRASGCTVYKDIKEGSELILKELQNSLAISR